METPPPQGIDINTLTKYIRDELDLNNKYFEFSQTQAEKDRAYFKHLYGYAIAFLVFMVAVASYFSYSSVNQMRADMEKSVVSALENVRIEVKHRIDTEFQRENILYIVGEAAKEHTKKELAGVISSETAAQVAKAIQDQSPVIQNSVEDQTRVAVQALQPTITQIINSELDIQVKKAVAPIEAQMNAYAQIITTEKLSALVRSGDRKAFDQLIDIGFNGTVSRSEETRILAQATVKDVIRQKRNPLHRMHLNFRVPQTPDKMKELLTTSDIVEDRLASIDNYPKEDKSILPILVEVIKNDDDLEVVWTAFQHFNELAKQSIEFPAYDQVANWWAKNSAAFEQEQK